LFQAILHLDNLPELAERPNRGFAFVALDASSIAGDYTAGEEILPHGAAIIENAILGIDDNFSCVGVIQPLHLIVYGKAKAG
jgi:hypothetical protein